MAKAAHSTTIKISGTPVALVGEATTEIETDRVFQITNPAKRVIDPAQLVNVKIDGVGQADGSYTIDYLFGLITFNAPIAALGVVTIDGAYLPVAAIAEAHEFSLSGGRDMLDSTPFGVDAKRREAGLLDASGSLSVFDDLSDLYGADTLMDLLLDGTPKLIEIHPAASGKFFRLWALFESEELGGSVADLVNATLNFTAAPVQGSGQSEGAAIGFGT